MNWIEKIFYYFEMKSRIKDLKKQIDKVQNHYSAMQLLKEINKK